MFYSFNVESLEQKLRIDTTNPIEIYQTANGEIQVEVRFEQETVWLSQAQMVELFGRANARIFLSLGLVLSGLTMMAMGLIPWATSSATIIFVLLFINSWFQGMGWRPVVARWCIGGQNLSAVRLYHCGIAHIMSAV